MHQNLAFLPGITTTIMSSRQQSTSIGCQRIYFRYKITYYLSSKAHLDCLKCENDLDRKFELFFCHQTVCSIGPFFTFSRNRTQKLLCDFERGKALETFFFNSRWNFLRTWVSLTAIGTKLYPSTVYRLGQRNCLVVTEVQKHFEQILCLMKFAPF